MKKITGRQLRRIFTGDDGWDYIQLTYKVYWEKKAAALNSYFYPPDLDEQSNECPIPTLQEDA